ncbi:hypothetical protein GCM10007906_30490 [Vibrio hyugaensis]|uniref:Uncharacterized protein n=1 Tax=Vibrio hyugaensis TaxID=1534743 RepID=A0ABQ5Y3I9_9VIBR|nr:hypothetical protein GCM10007906_30490 [Vibrio hyugaensis]
MAQVVVEKSDAVDFAIVGRQNVMNHGENRDLNREYRIVGGDSAKCKYKSAVDRIRTELVRIL